MRGRRAQVGIELIVIVGIIFIFMIPFLYAMLDRAFSFSTKSEVAKSAETLDRMVAAADAVGKMGPGSSMKLKVSVPMAVVTEGSGIWGKEMFVGVNTPYGLTHVVRMSQFNLDYGRGIPKVLAAGEHTLIFYYPLDADDMSFPTYDETTWPELPCKQAGYPCIRIGV